MFIKSKNEDLFWLLLHEGFAVQQKDGIIGVKDGLKPFSPEILEKYKNVIDFEVVEEQEGFDDYRTWKDFNPKWATGMLASNKYKQYFK